MAFVSELSLLLILAVTAFLMPMGKDQAVIIELERKNSSVIRRCYITPGSGQREFYVLNNADMAPVMVLKRGLLVKTEFDVLVNDKKEDAVSAAPFIKALSIISNGGEIIIPYNDMDIRFSYAGGVLTIASGDGQTVRAWLTNKPRPSITNSLHVPIQIYIGAFTNVFIPGTLGFSYLSGGSNLYILTNGAIMRRDILTAALVRDSMGFPVLEIKLNESGSNKLRLLTRGSVRQYAAIALDGRILSVPMIMEELHTDRLTISGDYSLAEWALIIRRMSAADQTGQ